MALENVDEIIQDERLFRLTVLQILQSVEISIDDLKARLTRIEEQPKD